MHLVEHDRHLVHRRARDLQIRLQALEVRRLKLLGLHVIPLRAGFVPPQHEILERLGKRAAGSVHPLLPPPPGLFPLMVAGESLRTPLDHWVVSPPQGRSSPPPQAPDTTPATAPSYSAWPPRWECPPP